MDRKGKLEKRREDLQFQSPECQPNSLLFCSRSWPHRKEKNSWEWLSHGREKFRRVNWLHPISSWSLTFLIESSPVGSPFGSKSVCHLTRRYPQSPEPQFGTQVAEVTVAAGWSGEGLSSTVVAGSRHVGQSRYCCSLSCFIALDMAVVCSPWRFPGSCYPPTKIGTWVEASLPSLGWPVLASCRFITGEEIA